MFKKATRQQLKLRLALIGPAGSGKTYTALRVARGLAGDAGSIAVIDSERGSASIYAGEVTEYDVCELESFHPERYIEAIQAADAQGYDVLIIDSLSHAWDGKDGALELKDRAAKRSRSGNSFTAWREITPLHNRMVDAILQCRAHVIVTMRAKTAYAQVKDEKSGRTKIEKLGMEAIQRSGMEYEFTVVGDLDLQHNLMVSKTRCALLDGAMLSRPGEALGQQLLTWLGRGEPVLTPRQQLAAACAEHELAVDDVLGFYESGSPPRRVLEWPPPKMASAVAWLKGEGAERFAAWQAGGSE